MISYNDIIKHFGSGLFEKDFQSFLAATFSDLTEYDILTSDYITSSQKGIELGFTNKTAVYDDDENVVFEKGNPLFSHVILYPTSSTLVDSLPYNTNFADKRAEVILKAGNPTQTNEGFSILLNKNFLIDNYKIEDIIVTYDYDEAQKINFIQIRDNNLVEHLKL